MGRMLSWNDYGILASLIAFINILLVFSSTIVIIFTKFSAAFFSREEHSSLEKLLKKGVLYVGIFSAVILAFLLIFSNIIADFLHIKDFLLVDIISLTTFFIFIASVPSGVLQGMLKFVPYSLITVFSSLVKLLTALLLVSLGLEVLGASSAYLISSLLGLLFFMGYAFTIVKAKNGFNGHIELKKKLLLYAIPVFFSTLSFNAFYSVDMIMVRHYFPDDISGQYAALALMARSIFFLVAPIATVLLPVVAQKHEKKEKTVNTLLLSVLLVSIPILFLSIVYFAYPSFIINLFFQSKADTLKVVSPYMGIFSIIMLFYSICFLLNNFFFAIGKTKVSIITTSTVVFEVVLIYLFHDNISQIVNQILITVVVLFISLLTFYIYVAKKS